MDGSRIAYRICSDRKELIKFHYEQENSAWHLSVHENGGSVQENIEDANRSISPDAVVYEVLWDGKRAAMFSRYEDEYGNLAMEMFHVGKGYRITIFFEAFWKLVKGIFGNEFYVGVYQQNSSAVEHLYKQGFEVAGSTEHRKKRIFIFKSILCPLPPQLH